MQIAKAEIIKTRQEHRKTEYRVVITKKCGFWIFSSYVRAKLNWVFDSYEQAHKWVRRNWPDVKIVTGCHEA